jgi:uncharacterized protein (DUF305 family)
MRGAPPVNDRPEQEEPPVNIHRFARCAALAAVLVLPVTGVSPALAAGKVNATDRAFVRLMVPHHQMATEMAEIAKTDGEHAKIRRLARKIIKAQNAEIRTLRRIAGNLGVKPAEMPMDGEMSAQTMRDLETLGLTEEESGMAMDMHDLHGAKPLDRMFIDMMIPHHQGAIRMARAELAKGKNRQLRNIARVIARDQAKEIRTMNAWREAWYGAPSPAGGVPTS